MRILVTLFGIFCISQAVAQTGVPRDRRANAVTFAPLAEAPESARLRINPFEGNSNEAAAGAKLFARHCAECHGAKAGGTRHGPSLLEYEVREAPPGSLFWVLTNGVVRRGMPVWSKLPDQQRWQIVTFLQSLGSRSHDPVHE